MIIRKDLLICCTFSHYDKPSSRRGVQDLTRASKKKKKKALLNPTDACDGILFSTDACDGMNIACSRFLGGLYTFCNFVNYVFFNVSINDL